MRIINCICGHRVRGDDDQALFAAYRAHVDGACSEGAISDEEIGRVLTESSRLTRWDGETRRVDGALDVHRLQPELADDFLRFFDRDAFMDNPSWSGCYCLFYQFTGDDWDAATPADNRQAKELLIRRGEAHGYLAYLDGDAVGWCHAAPRASLPGLDRVPDFRCDDDPAHIGAIVCFNVAAPYRAQGLARLLLNAACDGLRDDGFAVAEAYPARRSRSDARDYHGRLGMYLDAGFAVHRESEHYAIVRRAL